MRFALSTSSHCCGFHSSAPLKMRLPADTFNHQHGIAALRRPVPQVKRGIGVIFLSICRS
jgi:hypothetical protein